MNRFNQFLAVTLSVQIVIAGGIYFDNQASTADQTQMALLSTEKSQINQITIEDSDGKQTVLSKIEGKWLLPDYHQLPANQSKVLDMLNTLETTKSGWPVATTESGRERFEVADKNFQKRVVLSQDDEKLQTLYLGTSPGFRQLHVRRANEEEAYAVKLNSHDFPSENNNWLDQTLLQPKGDITSLEGPDYAFIKQAGQWQPSAEEGKAVSDEIEKITNTLTHINIQGAEEKTEHEAAYQLTVKAAGDTLNYHFFKDDENYYLSRDDYAQAFKINQSDYDKITGQTAMQLIKPVEAEELSTIVDSENNEAGNQNLNKSSSEQETTKNKNS